MSTKYTAHKENITSVNEYIDVVNKIFSEWGITNNIGNVIFRGQPFDLPLLPSVFRRNYNEKYILEVFSSLYRNYTSSRLETNSEMLAFMQHYGFPTRLLDWSENSLMSLFFSIDSEKENLSPVIWVLNVEGINSITHKDITGLVLTDNNLISARFEMIRYLEGEDLIPQFFDNHNFCKIRNSLENPLAFYPVSSNNPRIITQKGVFTIHGTKKKSIEELILEKRKDNFLKKITIDSKSLKKIIDELYILGITPRSIYPDFEGFSKEVKYKAET